jgi:hypothetical protein
MRFWKLAGTALWACVAAAQGLSPELQLLERIKSHMREELSQLPNYTCLETLARFQNGGDQSKSRGRLEPLDTVRLEIVYSNRREWYGAPGDRNFSYDNPIKLVDSGLIGTGAFAIMLANVFKTSLITNRGREELGGRTAAKYDFRMPGRALEISVHGGFGVVGLEGSFWADPQSLDLIRLDARAIDIPRYLPVEEDSTKVYYARTQIGEYSALLAQQADLHMLETKGAESYDRIEFTHCRAFSTQSAIHFDSEPHDAAEPVPPDNLKAISAAGAVVEAVPPFLLITVQLTRPVTDKDAVGEIIEAKVSGDVVLKRKIVIPNGSLVRGRIRRLERYREKKSADFVVGLEFTEVEVSGGSLRFYADLLRMDKLPGIRPSLSEQVLVRTSVGVEAKTQTITLPELLGVASFFVQGKTFAIPSGFRTVWRTRGPIRGLARQD